MKFPMGRVLLAVAFFGAQVVGAEKPNIVLISLDTFRADRLAAWGGPSKLAPNLNALAAKGSVYTACFAPAPVTLPSHATLLTGAFPELTGLRDNGFGHLAKDVPTLAEVLAGRGYSTAAIVAAPVLEHRYGLSRGFASYDDALGPVVSRKASEVTDRALAKLRAPRRGPLFLWVHYFDTHFPYEAPAAFKYASAESLYDRAASYVDSEVGRLLKALPEDTIVAVVSDHGEALGDHGELTHGVFLFQCTIHAVCFLQGPGVPAGKTCTAPASLADVARTLALLAGAPASSLRGDGIDLVALAQGGSAPPRWFPLEAWVPYSQYRWHPLFGVTDGRYKWVRGQVDRLYDLSADPQESRDLAAAPPAGAKALKAKLPATPSAAPSVGQVDPALLGLGYAPAPGGRFDPASLPDPHDKVATLLDIAKAKEERVSGQLEKAAARLSDATRRDQGNPAAWFEYGETLRRAGRPAEAVGALDRSLAIAPELYEGWTAKGHALAVQGKVDEAARCYQKALSIQPAYTPAVNAAAATHLGLRNLDKAAPLIDRAVASGIADANTYLLQGQVRLLQGKGQQAAKSFETAVRMSPHAEKTLNQVAEIYLEHQQVEAGERACREGIARYPAYAPNYLLLGSHLLQMNRPAEALPLFKKALGCELDPGTRERVSEVVRKIEAARGSASQ